MTNRRDWAVLSLGLIVGAGAASLYWHGSQGRSQFVFDHNLKCQQIAKRFESDSNYHAGVLKVSYSPTRNSCIAEVVRPDGGGTNYIVQDLLSGETIFSQACRNLGRSDSERPRGEVSCCLPMNEMLRTTSEVLELIQDFDRGYVNDWIRWLRVSQGYDFQVTGIPFLVASEFRQIMCKWQACRPKPYRSATDIQSTLDSATEPLKRMGSADLRSLQAPSDVLTDAIFGLWRIFEDGLCSQGKATVVGVSKAILLVTKGRIGPAFDSKVKAALNAQYVKDCGTYIKALREIANQLAGFEDREGTTLDNLAKQAGRPADVGRALDMVLGPRGARTA